MTRATEPECIHCGHEPARGTPPLDLDDPHPTGDWMRGIFVEDGECMWHRVNACENSSCEWSVGDIWL